MFLRIGFDLKSYREFFDLALIGAFLGDNVFKLIKKILFLTAMFK